MNFFAKLPKYINLLRVDFVRDLDMYDILLGFSLLGETQQPQGELKVVLASICTADEFESYLIHS